MVCRPELTGWPGDSVIYDRIGQVSLLVFCMGTNDFSRVISQLSDNYAVPIVLLLVAFAIVIYLNRKNIKNNWLNIKTRYRLKRLGHAQIQKLHCPDGLGYHFTVDRLILRHDGVTLLMNIKYPGKIFCADNIDYWTQMLGQKSYRFKNPFYDLECQIAAVSAIAPGVPVDGFLFFDHQAAFPKGHPDRVIYLKNIPQSLKQTKQHEVQPSVMSAWKKIRAMPHG